MAVNLSQNLILPTHKDVVMTKEGMPFAEQRALQAAEKILTPAQLQVFKKHHEESPYPKPGE